MTVSVAMAAYNGRQYIREQIESILNQTRLPNQLVICDDASSDGTFDYLKEILRNAPASVEIVLQRNERNLGFVRNFEKCFELCTGDILFCCDQDDIWDPEKIAVMTSVMERHPECVMAYHDAAVIDQNGVIIREHLYHDWNPEELSAIDIGIKASTRMGCVLGMSMCLRRELFENVRPFSEHFGHDEWFSETACCFGDICYCKDRLAMYRRHSSNTSGRRQTIWKRLVSYNRTGWFTHAGAILSIQQEFMKRYQDRAPDSLICTVQGQIAFQRLLTDITLRKSHMGGGKADS